jgi:hypothetical protein
LRDGAGVDYSEFGRLTEGNGVKSDRFEDFSHRLGFGLI